VAGPADRQTQPTASASTPRELPRLLMRRSGMLALAGLLLALVLGLLRAESDIDEEVEAAWQLATLMSQLGTLGQVGDSAALATLHGLQREAPLRHLLLQVHDTQGRSLLATRVAPEPAWIQTLLDAHRRLSPGVPPQRVSWLVPRPDGLHWVVSLDTSRESERREALANLTSMLVLLLLTVVAVLLAMHLNVRRALAPLHRLVAAIGDIERENPQAALHLPAMPVRELDSIASALRHLAEALAQADGQRRSLSRQLQTLQEDERHRLARELHDELGQRLTALRLDAAWLERKLAMAPHERELPAMQEVVKEMGGRCAELQNDVRGLLHQLNPLGPALATQGQVEPQRLALLLQELVDSWRHSPSQAPEPDHDTAQTNCTWELALQLGDDLDGLEPWPQVLALALYRMSQEALTNAARHAGARQVRLALWWEDRGGSLCWRAEDNGCGGVDPGTAAVRALRRGNGLAGLKERVWALGGQWQDGPLAALPPPPHLAALPRVGAQPGWVLQARWSWPLQA
jgi:two-component system sensor histidine kinase UhpB